MAEDYGLPEMPPFDDDWNSDALLGEAATGSSEVMMSLDGFTFDTLIGYDGEIARLRESGIVGELDEEWLSFVGQMQAQHGLYDQPVGDTIVFHSDAREDADRLMIATANELNRPIVRMRTMEGAEGSQALCIMSTPGIGIHGFADAGTLVLEGIDSWFMPAWFGIGEMVAGMPGDDAAQGPLKAVAFLRDAVSNPKVTVLASAKSPEEAERRLGGHLGHLTFFEVNRPSDADRDAIWDFMMDRHVSMSALDRFELVRLSRGLPRCDIFAAAREAVVQAFNMSLESRSYIPVTRDNLLDKIAAYQPIDSAEYREIEDSAVQDLLSEIERFEHDGC